MPSAHLTFYPHTHWDREWYRPFESFRADLLHVLDDALDSLERDPRLHFTLDGQMALVEDYLELRPEAAERMRALVAEGRLHVGPWYTASDTLLVDGEALIRNLTLGLRAASGLGAPMRVGYMPDQFGHAAQLPQIFRSCGIESAVLWRGVGPDRPPHTFRWAAPDGSEVTTVWLQDGYAMGRRLPSDPEGFAAAMERTLERLGPWLDGAPLLMPVGDDHVGLATWLPDAVEALRARRPDLQLAVGGLADHVERAGTPEHVVRGELRSPIHAPVLAGVASARVREKQAAARAASILLHYAEPLWAWLQAHGHPSPPRQLLDKAWRHLLQNHAHDSIAGCGVDETHDDVKARYRWAEQMAISARDRALAHVALDGHAHDALAHRAAFHPGPTARVCTVETELPRALLALDDQLVSRGADGVAWPVQSLGETNEPPLFEGEFAGAELSMYLGGLDPATPLFGRYLTGITTHPDGPGRVRLDVGLGESPVAPGALVEDQRKVQTLLATAERFRVVLHRSGVTARALIAAGPAPTAGFASIALERGTADDKLPLARKVDDATIAAGPVTVAAQPDGTVLITDGSTRLGALRANDLVDEGDRGDLYHYDAAGAPVNPRSAQTTVVEAGPLRARLRIVQELDLPVGLTADRATREAETRAMQVTTEVTLHAGSRRIDFVTTCDNQVRDHRLRVLAHAPLHAERLDVENGLAVVARPLDPTQLGAGNERPASTGQHHLFADISDGAAGVALMSRGLPEHEVVREGGATRLGLTLLRAVGWLARGDLSCIDHAAGPMVETPGAQELGPHRFEYALYAHDGDWEQGEVLAESRRYVAPAIVVSPSGKTRVPTGRGLLEPESPSLRVVASYPGADGLVVRVLNASSRAVDARLRSVTPVREAVAVDPLEQPLPRERAPQVLVDGPERDHVRVELGPWQLATLVVRI